LGCESTFPSKYHYYCNTTIQDLPESPIFHIFDETITFISEQISQHNPVLVHCVYGQSRSAVVCCAYLITLGMSFEEALTRLKACHPNICINPGFLAQLFLHTFRATYSVQYHFIHPHTSQGLSVNTEMVQCRDCLQPVVSLEDVIELDKEETLIQEAIELFIDPFWKDYHSLYSPFSSPNSLPSNLLVVRPVQWMIDETRSTTRGPNQEKKKRRKENLPLNDLHCCGCNAVIGKYRSKEEGGIRVVGGYLLSELYCIDRETVSIPIQEKIAEDKNTLDSDC
jgi:hypothetical protein